MTMAECNSIGALLQCLFMAITVFTWHISLWISFDCDFFC